MPGILFCDPPPCFAGVLPKGKDKELPKAEVSVRRAGASPAPTLSPPLWGGAVRSNRGGFLNRKAVFQCTYPEHCAGGASR